MCVGVYTYMGEWAVQEHMHKEKKSYGEEA